MRITKRTNIAVRLLMYCAAHEDRLVTKAEIAECCNISENHLAQVINQLSQLGYLATQRGRNGGMNLGRPAAEIRIGDVFRDVEGNLPMVECFADADNTCPLAGACRLKVALADAAQAFYASLDDISLESLVCDNHDLLRILQPVSCGAR
ncbi:RrF2 family transcriptional regulator [Leisingera aquaemixtae]|jgi:Rrf2 family nitric oxide-sensitive transcriptional repressor|uniref:HTH-type transcriptional repressor NsrR n=1 Tax=Leisingera aquaemixtae TaxID=1396826 RepID=A0A0N7M4Q3_9RHOB|nr:MULTISPECIES: Rrf2 family transcriptional regulator [Leisingera]QDI74739.1 Rrf2 family transcriptional regulator [Leisingera aquaemixtae]UWQ24148.1 Rrf2 family transcriptional regulator [Leisingera aquaemixtae]UWQ36684.1 Rrf2 family transcriptional regulator [Leisingera aquaemixtae]UWQ40781.1 Rrf2 family transcriptional regulator [Leisingera aquaemixtae]UWQ45051.1 Rrf2 family transcriptional regulator [Leisingera aquaemixtae]